MYTGHRPALLRNRFTYYGFSDPAAPVGISTSPLLSGSELRLERVRLSGERPNPQSRWVWLIRSSARRTHLHLISQQSPFQTCREKSRLSLEQMQGSVRRLRGSVAARPPPALVFMRMALPGLAHQKCQSLDCMS